MRATRATIDLARLRANLEAVGAHLRAVRSASRPPARICLAIKANAYGHGAVPVARAALQAGVSAFGVATVDEGVALREAGIDAPILLFSLPLPEEARAIAAAGLTPLCGDTALAHDLARAATAVGRTIDVHLKIDTGMARVGCRPEEAAAIAEQLRGLTGLRLTGLCTHFARSSEADQEFSRAQLAAFHDAIAAIPDRHRVVHHAANSGAIVGLTESHLDMVRLGVIAYGYYPGGDLPRPVAVQPVMELATRLTYLKRGARRHRHLLRPHPSHHRRHRDRHPARRLRGRLPAAPLRPRRSAHPRPPLPGGGPHLHGPVPGRPGTAPRRRPLRPRGPVRPRPGRPRRRRTRRPHRHHPPTKSPGAISARVPRLYRDR